MGVGKQSLGSTAVGQSESSGWLKQMNPWANPPGVFLCFFTGLPAWSTFAFMTVDDWLASERLQDSHDGFGPTLTDPVALRLLALGIHAARQSEQAPTLPQDRPG